MGNFFEYFFSTPRFYPPVSIRVSVHIATKKRPFWRARCKCLRYFKNKILRSEKPPVFSNIRNRLTQRILQRRRHFFAAKRWWWARESGTFASTKFNFHPPNVKLLPPKSATFAHKKGDFLQHLCETDSKTVYLSTKHTIPLAPHFLKSEKSLVKIFAEKLTLLT